MMKKGVDSGIGVLVPVGQKLPNLQKEIDDAVAVKSDGFKTADSVAQLAKELGVPEANLQKAVEQYNKACEVGHDGEYYKEKTYLRPLNTKKLYAIKLKAYFFSSYGGLNTNRKHQVLDKNNKPIKGFTPQVLKCLIWSDRLIPLGLRDMPSDLLLTPADTLP